MLFKTRGIVFRFTKYGETSIIVTIFTELFGLQSYIVNHVRSKTARNKIALYQPLSLLELVVYHRENAAILRIKEAKCIHPYQTIHKDLRKSTIAIFLNEVVGKAVKDQSHAEDICDFLISSLIAFDEASEIENFHLIFLLKLSRYLGFGPQTNDEMLVRGVLNVEDEALLNQLLAADFSTTMTIKYSSRKTLLEVLLRFYATHIENFGEVRSVEVLKDVLT